jgi:fatty acid-binding protein DegV
MQQQIETLESVQSLAVVHVRCRELAEKVASVLSETLTFPAERILLTETGPPLSTHSGPKVVGVVAVS